MRGAHAQWKDLDLRLVLGNNKGPKPVTWTKSAEGILETLAAYRERITRP